MEMFRRSVPLGLMFPDLNEVGVHWQQQVPIASSVPEPAGQYGSLLFALCVLLIQRKRR